MKCITVLGLVAICAMGCLSMVPPPLPPHNPLHPVVVPTPPPAPTMTADLEGIHRMINVVQIRQLTTRYLLNDAEFQAFVRIINSQDAFLCYMRFRSQPEVMAFIAWVQAQIMASGGELQMEETEEVMNIINPTPFWANTVFGWQGFLTEFKLYCPLEMVRNYINMKIAQNGIFAHLWKRLVALNPVYERVIGFPECQRVNTKLQANAIDVVQLEDFLRNLVGWQRPATVAPQATTVAPAVSSSTSTSTENIESSTASAAIAPVAPVA